MSEPTYYYGAEGQEISGPLSIEAIRAGIMAGRLPENVLVAESPSGPWKTPGAIKGFKPIHKPQEKETAAPKMKTVSGFIEAIAAIFLVLGGLAISMFLYHVFKGTLDWFMWAGVAVGNLAAGVFTMAFAEILVRLIQIVEELRKR